MPLGPRAITDAATYLAAYNCGLESDDPNLMRVIESACQALEQETSRRYASGSYAHWHSGDLAARLGDTLYLADIGSRGLLQVAPITEVTLIEENGVELDPYLLSTATEFDDGEAAIVSDTKGEVRRAVISGGRMVMKSWASGVANIRVEFSGGFTTAATMVGTESVPATMPGDLIELALQYIDIYRKQSVFGSLDSMALAGENLRFVRALSDRGREILRSYSTHVPRTVEG